MGWITEAPGGIHQLQMHHIMPKLFKNPTSFATQILILVTVLARKTSHLPVRRAHICWRGVPKPFLYAWDGSQKLLEAD